MSKRRTNSKSNQAQSMASVRGMQRADHYANGGTPQMYRGAARTLDNKTKARASKQACRGRVAY
jgi:hypothetical protein